MEGIINMRFFNTLFNSLVDTNDGETQLRGKHPMPKNCLQFVYGYTVCCEDRGKMVPWLSNKELQANPKSHVFKTITPSDEGWAVCNVVNHYDGWCQKFEQVSDMRFRLVTLTMNRFGILDNQMS